MYGILFVKVYLIIERNGEIGWYWSGNVLGKGI